MTECCLFEQKTIEIKYNLKYSQRKNYRSYAKKVIDKNVDHMNPRKILYGSVKERFIQ